jgi:hypothetical protein
MPTPQQDVGHHWAGTRPLHQHHHLHIQYVTLLLTTTHTPPFLTTCSSAATSAANIILDLWILFLPLKVLLSIQRPGREKTALLAIFALGAFSCIASIARLYSVRIFTKVRNPSLIISSTKIQLPPFHSQPTPSSTPSPSTHGPWSKSMSGYGARPSPR